MAPADNSADSTANARLAQLSARIDFVRDSTFRLRADFVSPGGAPELGADHASQVLGVYGPSGAGKTSLLHLWAGLLTPRSGHLRYGSRVFFSRDGVNLAPPARRVGYIFQDTRVFPHLSVSRNLLYGARSVPAKFPRPFAGKNMVDDYRRETRFEFDAIVAALGLADLLSRRADRLSGGQQKRVAIARAFLSQPDLLLCDEAGTNLDARSRTGFFQLMRSLPVGVRAIYVSHDLAEIARLSDEVLVLDRGESIYHGSPRGLAGDPAARELFARSGTLPPVVVRRDQIPDFAHSSGPFRSSHRIRQAPDDAVFVFDPGRMHLARAVPGDITGFPNRWPARLLERIEWNGRACARVALFEQEQRIDAVNRGAAPEALVPFENEAGATGLPGWRAGEALVCLVDSAAGL